MVIPDIELSNKSLLHILLFKGALFERRWSRAVGNKGKNVPTVLENYLPSWKTVLLALKKPLKILSCCLFYVTVSCNFGVNVIGQLFDGKKIELI